MREVDRQDNDGPYRADWETLRKFEMPQWYKDAKFGIFIHWGVLAVSGEKVEWHQSGDALEVKLPASAPGKYA